jgi:hypothetical protein
VDEVTEISDSEVPAVKCSREDVIEEMTQEQQVRLLYTRFGLE